MTQATAPSKPARLPREEDPRNPNHRLAALLDPGSLTLITPDDGSGMLAATGGLVMLANYNSAKADYGSTYTLLTVLIVVLGGVNPNGGSGRLFGVVLAVLILQVLSSGLNMFPNVSNFYRPLIWGGVLLAVMVANYFSKDKSLLRRFPRREKSR